MLPEQRVHGRERHAGHHALDHEPVDQRAHQGDQRVRVARAHGAGGDARADQVRGGAAVRLEHGVAHADDLVHAGARGGRDGLREEHHPRLVAVVELVHGAQLRVEPVERVLVLGDAGQDEARLLGQQVLQRGLDDVRVRGEVVEQRGALDAQRGGEARGRQLEALAGEHGDGGAGELAALLGFDGSGHG